MFGDLSLHFCVQFVHFSVEDRLDAPRSIQHVLLLAFELGSLLLRQVLVDLVDVASGNLARLSQVLHGLRLNIFEDGDGLELEDVLDCQRIEVHIEVLEESVLNEEVDCLHVRQVENSERHGGSLDSVPQQQVLEALVKRVLAGSVLQQNLEGVEHDLHEAGELLLAELLLDCEIAVQVRVLLNDSRGARVRQVLAHLEQTLLLQPLVAERTAVSLLLGTAERSASFFRHLPVEEKTALSLFHFFLF